MLALQTAPPITGPKKRENDTVLWASPLARPTTWGGDMALISTMTEVYANVPAQYLTAVIVTKQNIKKKLPSESGEAILCKIGREK